MATQRLKKIKLFALVSLIGVVIITSIGLPIIFQELLPFNPTDYSPNPTTWGPEFSLSTLPNADSNIAFCNKNGNTGTSELTANSTNKPFSSTITLNLTNSGTQNKSRVLFKTKAADSYTLFQKDIALTLVLKGTLLIEAYNSDYTTVTRRLFPDAEYHLEINRRALSENPQQLLSAVLKTQNKWKLVDTTSISASSSEIKTNGSTTFEGFTLPSKKATKAYVLSYLRYRYTDNGKRHSVKVLLPFAVNKKSALSYGPYGFSARYASQYPRAIPLSSTKAIPFDKLEGALALKTTYTQQCFTAAGNLIPNTDLTTPTPAVPTPTPFVFATSTPTPLTNIGITPTKTPIRTATPTKAPTPTFTKTPTPTATRIPVTPPPPTKTPTSTATPTKTPTQTYTPTPTSTPTPTINPADYTCSTEEISLYDNLSSAIRAKYSTCNAFKTNSKAIMLSWLNERVPFNLGELSQLKQIIISWGLSTTARPEANAKALLVKLSTNGKVDSVKVSSYINSNLGDLSTNPLTSAGYPLNALREMAKTLSYGYRFDDSELNRTAYTTIYRQLANYVASNNKSWLVTFTGPAHSDKTAMKLIESLHLGYAESVLVMSQGVQVTNSERMKWLTIIYDIASTTYNSYIAVTDRAITPNKYVMESSGLYQVALFFRDFSQAPNWLKGAATELDNAYNSFVKSDGSWSEHAEGYTAILARRTFEAMAIREFMRGHGVSQLQSTNASQYEFTPNTYANELKLANWLMATTNPYTSHSVLPIGDTNSTSASTLICGLPALNISSWKTNGKIVSYCRPPHLDLDTLSKIGIYGYTQLASQANYQYQSSFPQTKLFETSKLLIISNEAKRWFGALQAVPKGSLGRERSHSHFDVLSFQFFDGTRNLFIDPGYGAKDVDQHSLPYIKGLSYEFTNPSYAPVGAVSSSGPTISGTQVKQQFSFSYKNYLHQRDFTFDSSGTKPILYFSDKLQAANSTSFTGVSNLIVNKSAPLSMPIKSVVEINSGTSTCWFSQESKGSTITISSQNNYNIISAENVSALESGKATARFVWNIWQAPCGSIK